MTKMIRAWGNAGRMQAEKYVTSKSLRRCNSAPEAIWRQEKYSDGTTHYCRFINMGGKPRCSDISGNYWATATLTIDDWFKRYAA